MHTPEETNIFINGMESAIRTIFKTLDEYSTINKKQVESLENFRRQLESGSQNVVSKPNDLPVPILSNKLHNRNVINLISIIENQNYENSKIEKDLTEQCLQTMAGALLQISKQVLSYRWESKNKIENSHRQIGQTEIIDVIWEGRNHSQHWENPKPNREVSKLFKQLKEDFSTLKFDHHFNCSLKILHILNWNSPEIVISDLKILSK